MNQFYKILGTLTVLATIFVSTTSAQDMLIGKIKLKQLHEQPYSEWFDSQYAAYNVDESATDSINFTRSDKVVLVMATWCGDSKREVPRFFKILEKKGISTKKVQILCVDRKKQISDMDISEYNAVRVPTFIFYRKGKEIGRIIESPTTSLEKDMLNILK